MDPRRSLKGRGEWVFLALGIFVFGAGLAGNLVGGSRPAKPLSEHDVHATPNVSVGPGEGVLIDAYIRTRRGALSELETQRPNATARAVVSFDRYLTGLEVERLLDQHGLRALRLLTRIPLTGFKDRSIVVGPEGISQALITLTGTETQSKIRDELEELIKLIPTVDQPEFKRVYEEDAANHRRALEMLDGDPAIIYAVNVEGTAADLVGIAGSAAVRLVDLVPHGAPANVSLFGLHPEDETKTGSGPR
ncbi:MAG TPA: hypothetical protein VI541_01060 [Actinomycetota bacterium]|nr:hypothetical protein [Actinomycetota bacterium]